MDEHEHHHHDHGITSAHEAKALLDYMYKHNASHTSELIHLAEKLKETGNEEAYVLVMSAVESYEKGNTALAAALEKVSE